MKDTGEKLTSAQSRPATTDPSQVTPLSPVCRLAHPAKTGLSAEIFSALFKTAHDGICMIDVKGEILQANEAFCRMSGYGKEELVGMHIGRLEAVQPPQEVAARIEQTLAGKGHAGFVTQNRRKDGSIFDVDITALTVDKHNGRIAVIIRDVTENKRAEEALKQRTAELAGQRKRLFDVLETLPAMVCLLQPDYHVIFANRSFRAKFGDANERRCYEYCCGFDEPCDFCQAFVPLKTGKPHHWEFISPDGGTILDVNDFPFTDADGSPLILEMDIEITEQRKAEEALRQKDIELQLVADTTPVVLTRISRDLRYIFINRAFTEMFGLPREKIIGKSLLEIIGRDALEVIQPYIDRVLRGEHVEYEAQIPYKGAGRRFMHVEYVPERNDKGDVSGWIASIQDITERKQAEEALRESEQRYRDLIETPNSIIMTADTNLNITYINDFGLKFFGYEASELIGKNVVGTTIPETDDEGQDLAAMAREIMQHPEQFKTNVHQNRRKDGSLVWVSWTNRVKYDGHGEPVEILAVGSDITPLKQAEEQLRKLNESLEQRVAERTLESQKQSDQLRALANQLSRAEEAERQRVSKILHDHIQQLIVAARMELAWMRDAPESARRTSIDTADRILNETLEATRSLAVELSPPVLQHGGLVPALKWLADRMRDKNHFAVDVSAGPEAEPDGEHTRCLLFECARELLLNSLKHSGVWEARVCLSRPGPGQVQLVVCDEGEGFNPDLLENRCAEEATFGLFSIRQRLAHIGGRMHIDSAAGQGARFTLTAPA